MTNYLHAFVRETLLTFSDEFEHNPNSPIPVPRLISRGARLAELLPEQEYLPMKEKGRTQFDCSRCGASVISGALKDHWLQACRCSFLLSFRPADRFSSAGQWTEWQTIYDKESADPMPVDDIKTGSLLGTLPELPQVIHDWASRRQGLPAGMRYNWNGTITAGDAMISIGEQGTVTTFDPDDREGLAKSAKVLRHIAQKSEPPRYIVCCTTRRK